MSAKRGNRDFQITVQDLEELFKKQSNRKEINEATHNLEVLAENFILQKVNDIIGKNLTGKKI